MAHNDTRRLTRCPPPSAPAAAAADTAAMDPAARRRACVAFRAKLSRDTGVNLTAAECAVLVDETCEGEGGEQVSLQSAPGLFYGCLGASIANHQALARILPDQKRMSWWCYREAAEVHGRGLHSFTVQLNLSRVWHKKTPYTPLNTLKHPLDTGYTTPTRNTRTPYPIQSAQMELKSGRV